MDGQEREAARRVMEARSMPERWQSLVRTLTPIGYRENGGEWIIWEAKV